jgi:Protein of unknown function (DUF3592)
MKGKGLLVLLVVSLVWTIFFAAVDGSLLWDQFRQIRATGFPQSTGIVSHSQVTSHQGSKGGTQYDVEMEYSYRVNGEAFKGERYRYNNYPSSDSKWATVIVDQHPVGAAVPVFYDPQIPGEALLSPGIDGSDLFNLLFLTPFNLVMVGLWATVFTVLKDKVRPPVAGGARWTEERRSIRVRLPRYPAAVCGLVFIAFASFISIFPLGIGFGFHPSVPVALLTWVTVLGGGLGVAAWQWLKAVRGDFDLVIHPMERTVELPATFGRKCRRREPFSAFSGIKVENIVVGEYKGERTYRHGVILQRKDGGTDQLTEWCREERAVSLAEWLRERLPGVGSPPARR